MTPTDPTNPPTIALVDSAGIQAFRDAMGAYYTPPVQPSFAFDPSGNTPDVILTENIANAIRDTNRANTNAWQAYKSELFNCVQVSGPAGDVTIPYLPHAPVYHTVNVAKFTAGWNAWMDEFQRTSILPQFDQWMVKYPYLDTVSPLLPPVVKVGKEANAPPPPPFTTDVVGTQIAPGVYLATPLGYAAAIVQLQSGIPDVFTASPLSPTGYFRFVHSPFGGTTAFWMPCPRPSA